MLYFTGQNCKCAVAFPIYPVAQGFWCVTANVFCILLLSYKIYGWRETAETVRAVRARLYSLYCTQIFWNIWFWSSWRKGKENAEKRGSWEWEMFQISFIKTKLWFLRHVRDGIKCLLNQLKKRDLYSEMQWKCLCLAQTKGRRREEAVGQGN